MQPGRPLSCDVMPGPAARMGQTALWQWGPHWHRIELSRSRQFVMLTTHSTPRILVIEDEPTLGHLLIRALEWDGYDVVWVNGEAGLRAAKMWGKSYDLVITNSRRPGAAGADPIALVHNLFPGLPVLHLDQVSQPKGEAHDGPTLYKPFGVDSLSEAVRELLAERTHAPI